MVRLISEIEQIVVNYNEVEHCYRFIISKDKVRDAIIQDLQNFENMKKAILNQLNIYSNDTELYYKIKNILDVESKLKFINFGSKSEWEKLK